MAGYSFLYLTSDGTDKIQVGIAKDLELVRFVAVVHITIDGKRDRIVHVERYNSLLEANGRLLKIKRMSHRRRTNIVRKTNPNLLEVSENSIPQVDALRKEQVLAMSPLVWLVDEGVWQRMSDNDSDEGLGGVGARIPLGGPRVPRSDSYKQPRPNSDKLE